MVGVVTMSSDADMDSEPTPRLGRGKYIRARTIRPTPTELVILEYIVQDLTDDQIAVRVSRSVHTIKSHIKKLIALTRVNSRVGLAITFVRWREMGQPNQYWDEPKDVYAQMGRGKNGKPQG